MGGGMEEWTEGWKDIKGGGKEEENIHLTEQMNGKTEQSYLSHDTNTTSNDSSFRLCTTHTTQACRNKNLWTQYSVF